MLSPPWTPTHSCSCWPARSRCQRTCSPARRERTLLLVDDEPNIVSALRRLFRREGYRIVTASSGAEGLQRMAEYEVDVWCCRTSACPA